jgi:glycosyltransferase
MSIVCICRNAAGVMDRCIASVAAQDYPNIEFIIFDGASTDGTVAVLRRQDAVISTWISEPDKGRADGFNKALAAASGDYLMGLMADDWLSPSFVADSIAAFKRHQCDYLTGDCMLHEPGGGVLYRRAAPPNFERGLRSWMTINSPCWVIRRQMLDEIGLFDELSVASDYDWFLRAHLAGYRGAYEPSLLCHFQVGGISSSRAFLGYWENLKTALSHGMPVLPAWRSYVVNMGRHLARDLLGALLPAAVLLTLRRWRQRRISGAGPGA